MHPALNKLCQLLDALPDDPRLFAARWSEVSDPELLLALARDHGVHEVLTRAFDEYNRALDEDTPPLQFPTPGPERLEQKFLKDRLETTLTELTDLFERAGLDVVVMKGPPMVERIYGDSDARPSQDIDLLVRESDYEATRRALEAVGYQQESGPSAEHQREHYCHMQFFRDKSPLVEVHFRLMTGFGVHIPSEPFVDRAISRERLSGKKVRVLWPDDEFFFCVLHASHHALNRMCWLYDLKLMYALDGPDLAALTEQAREFRVERAWLIGLRVLNTDIGAGLRRPPIEPRFSRLRLRATLRFMDRLRQPLRPRSLTFNRLMYQAVLCDSLGLAGRFWAYHLGHISRRRLHALAPNRLPESWAG